MTIWYHNLSEPNFTGDEFGGIYNANNAKTFQTALALRHLLHYFLMPLKSHLLYRQSDPVKRAIRDPTSFAEI